MKAARAGLAALLLAAACAAAQDPGIRLEAHAVRIAKLHAQLGQGVLPQRSRRALAEAVRDFDGLLSAATRGAGAAEIRDNYLLLGLLWRDYRAWALKPATRENARRLEERLEEIAWLAAKGVRLAHRAGRSGTGRLALEAVAAAAAAQRLARLHLLRRWGLAGSSAAERSLAAARLRGAIGQLRGSTYNTPVVATELEVAEGQLDFLLAAARELEEGRGASRHAEFVAKAADHILESLERAARLYEGLGS